jgi:hypothetical protein
MQADAKQDQQEQKAFRSHARGAQDAGDLTPLTPRAATVETGNGYLRQGSDMKFKHSKRSSSYPTPAA